MITIRQQHRHLVVACELDHSEAGRRLAEWEQLRVEHGLGAEAIARGARLWLRGEARRAAENLARREAACCGFLDLELAKVGDRLQLDITSPAPEAAPVIGCLAGLEAGGALPCC